MFERQRWRRTHSSARSPRPDAIYATLDRLALGALRAAQARSIPVPDELLIAVGAFAVGSLVCALSGSMEGLIVGRVIQGTGAALGPLAIGLARDAAPPERAPLWIGLLIGATGVGAHATHRKRTYNPGRCLGP